LTKSGNPIAAFDCPILYFQKQMTLFAGVFSDPAEPF
jgi:hypothetical protein